MKEPRETVSMKESTYKMLVEKQLELSNRERKVMSMDQVIYELVIEHNTMRSKSKKK